MTEKEYTDKAEEEKDAKKESGVIEEIEAFVCPSCGAEVTDDTVVCPGCGALFDFEEKSVTPDIESEESQPESSGIEDETPPLPADSEEAIETPEESKGEAPLTSRPDISPSEEPAPSEPIPQPTEEPAPYVVRGDEVRMAGALKEYSTKRRKRYLFGALSTGLGILFYVLLWLYIVHQVWIEDTGTIFGLEVILLLVIASVLFMLGMYLILTYPKSALMDVFSTMPRAEQARE